MIFQGTQRHSELFKLDIRYAGVFPGTLQDPTVLRDTQGVFTLRRGFSRLLTVHNGLPRYLTALRDTRSEFAVLPNISLYLRVLNGIQRYSELMHVTQMYTTVISRIQ